MHRRRCSRDRRVRGPATGECDYGVGAHEGGARFDRTPEPVVGGSGADGAADDGGRARPELVGLQLVVPRRGRARRQGRRPGAAGGCRTRRRGLRVRTGPRMPRSRRGSRPRGLRELRLRRRAALFGVDAAHVRYWQVVKKANVNRWLSPLWTSVEGKWVATGPDLYRGLLNALYDGVKAADPRNLVVTAGAAPYGLNAGGVVMRPAYWWRRVLCLDDSQPPRPS